MAHAKELRRRRTLLTSEQRREPAYATDSPNWARWFAFEHEEARRRGVSEVDHTVPPPLLVVREEDQAALAADYRESEKDERHRTAVAKQEEAAYEAAMAQAMALSAAGDCVLPPMTPPSTSSIWIRATKVLFSVVGAIISPTQKQRMESIKGGATKRGRFLSCEAATKHHGEMIRF
ncbi:hypothetical protein D1007_26454 [Hordeum vulgare]|nr:hypothetical protein D1007_26454 [Hordeum vulgare]